MTILQTGEVRTKLFLAALLPQLQKAGELCALDTVEMEELLAWVSTVMAIPTLSTSQLVATLTAGLEDLSWTTNETGDTDVLLSAILQAIMNVRMAGILRKPGKPAKVFIYT